MNLSKRIAYRIHRKAPGWVFTPSDFFDLGTPHAVGMTLLRLSKSGDVRRLACGIYDAPKQHPVLGVLHARPEAILAAISRRDCTIFVEHESYAANRLRLTEQVPARHIYLTNGRSRIIRVGPHTLEIRHRAPRKLTLPTGMSARVFGALRNIGKANVTSERLMPLRTLLSPKDRRALLFDLTKAPAWIHAHLRMIAQEEVP
jgi:hypothetical protein